MRRRLTALLLPVVAIALGAAWLSPSPAATQDGVSVYFSPLGGCTDAIIDMIERADDTIRVQAYSFTSAPIAKAILEAHKSGVEVTVILDSSQRTAQYSSATFFRNQGIPVFIDSDHAIAHNKVILIDDDTIITGSFNFSRAAEERNAENLLVIEDKPTLAAAYARNFADHFGHSRPYALDRDTPKTPSKRPELATVSVAGDKYHFDDCPRIPAHAVKIALKDAKKRGLTECSTCRPGPRREISRPPDDAAANITVHITRTGKKYHRAGCRYLSKSDIPISKKDARRRGLGPCKVCKP